ncbi:MAG: BrnA antitoxin family protein [Anaerolineales bacterium]
MTDDEIDFSDIPEVTPEMFAKGVVQRGLQPITKQQLTLRLDSDVIDWFKKQGRGYQTRMNALLRAYMQEHDKAHGSHRS